jgi:transcriptional accessory protein Tex/SPT6
MHACFSEIGILAQRKESIKRAIAQNDKTSTTDHLKREIFSFENMVFLRNRSYFLM